MAKAVPEGLRTITPQFSVDGCDQAIEWYQKALGAELVMKAPDPSGKKVWHAQMSIGDSSFFLNDLFPEMSGGAQQTASLWIYGDNIDQKWKRAIDAGGKAMMPMADMFWGDRMGTLVDPFGIRWTLAQHLKDLTQDEMMKAQEAFVAQMKK